MATLKDKLYEKLSYTSQDYNKILEEIIEVFNGTNPAQTSWNNVSESDIMFIVMSLMAAHKDILNYMVDYRILESFMSTARERSSLVRIANSFGFKIPSYKAAKARVSFSSYETAGVNEVVLPSFTQLLDSEGTTWTYIGSDLTLNLQNQTQFDVYQGTSLSVRFNPQNVNRESMTHIISNATIAIGNNANQNGVSKLVVQKNQETPEVWEEVENIYTYAGASERVYELNVDPQGITYIKFLKALNLDLYNDYVFTLYYVVTQGASILNIGTQAETSLAVGQVSADATFGRETNQFIAGASPLKVSDIREAFKNYYAGIDSLVTLNDYKNFVLNRQKAASGITKCLIIDGQGDTLNGNGNAADFTGTSIGVYVLKENNVELTSTEEAILLNEISKYKITGVLPSINGNNAGDDLAAQPLKIIFNALPGNENTLASFKQFLIDYVKLKGIGESITTSELYTLILNSIYAPSFTTGISISIVLSNNDPYSGTEYYQYLTLLENNITT